MPKFTVGEALRFGWNEFKKNAGFWLGVAVVYAVLVGIPAGIAGSMHRGSTEASFFNFVTNVVEIWLGMGIMRMSLMVVDRKMPAFNELFAGSKHWVSYVVCTILLGFMTFIGFLLLIVPGIIVLLMFGSAPYFVLDKGVGGIEALKMAKTAAKGQLGALFLYALAAIGLSILGAIPLLLGLLVVAPVLALASAYIYRKISAGVPVPAAPKVATKAS
jgi:uncharacterized membrane protein